MMMCFLDNFGCLCPMMMILGSRALHPAMLLRRFTRLPGGGD